MAHSHGGDVVKIASWYINHSITNLANLGTPQNWDLPDINRAAVKNYCNGSSLEDSVQFAGSSPTQIYYTVYDLYNGILAEFYAWDAFLAGDWGGFSTIRS